MALITKFYISGKPQPTFLVSKYINAGLSRGDRFIFDKKQYVIIAVVYQADEDEIIILLEPIHLN